MIALNLRSAIFAFFVLFIGVSAIALDPAVQSDTRMSPSSCQNLLMDLVNGTITSSTSAVAAETSSPSSSYEIEAARGGGGRVGGGYRGGIVGGGGARSESPLAFCVYEG